MAGADDKSNTKAARKEKKRLLTRQVNEIDRYIAEGRLIEFVTEKRENVKLAFEEFEIVHEQYMTYITDDAETDSGDKYFQEAQVSYVDALTRLNAYIEQLEAPNVDVVSDLASVADAGQSDFGNLMNLPRVEIETFTGDPMKYHAFIAVFEQSVEKYCKDGGVRLTRLLQYTDGKAKGAIRACAIVGGDRGYEKAREILKQRFGDQLMITESITEKLRCGKPVYSKQAIQDLADDLTSCVVTLKEMDRIQEIDTQRTIVDIVDRLPKYARHRWQKIAIETKRNTQSYPDIDHLLSFICDLADEVNDPVYGSREDKLRKPQQFKERSKGSPRSYSANTMVQSETGAPAQGQLSKATSTLSFHICPLCKNNHILFYCQQFKSMKPLERHRFVISNQLCENCLLNNHSTDQCRKPSRCTVCNEKHTKFIHINANNRNGDQLNNVQLSSTQGRNEYDSNVSSDVNVSDVVVDQNVSHNVQVTHNTQTCSNDQILLPLVPITVNGTYHTHALLDNASTNSFCTNNLATALNLKGTDIMLNLSTIEKSQSKRKTQTVSFTVSNCGETLNMSNVFVTESIPVPHVYTHETYKHLQGIPLSKPRDCKVDVLIGQDCSEALIPLEVVKGDRGDPYAVRTLLGWTVSGPYSKDGVKANNVSTNYIKLDKQVEKMWVLENELTCDDKAMSIEDKTVIDLWESKGRLHEGHYELPIPWARREGDERKPKLESNKGQAINRYQALKRRLVNDTNLNEQYKAGIQALITKGYAEPVPMEDLNRDDMCVFYLPHHPVHNVHKQKIRIVFDCSARYKGSSLNQQILQGPDLTNKLTSVLLRFRENKIAVVGDVEAMYHQVRVPVQDRDALRFLWSEVDNVHESPNEYRMTVHLFGGIWSSSTANYALRRTADENQDSFKQSVANSVRLNFYVDDWLYSGDDLLETTAMVHDVSKLLKAGGFSLTKFVSTDCDVIKSIPVEKRNKSLTNIDLDKHELPQDRALGVSWNVDNDTFSFKIDSMNKPFTRRGVIGCISSIYDPLGFVCPVVVLGKMVFRELTKLQLGWDDPMPVLLEQDWKRWLTGLTHLQNVSVDRCVKPPSFGKVVRTELHHFMDSSQVAYFVVTYIRLVDDLDQTHVTLLMSKSRLAPMKVMTIPRLELTAGVLAAKLDVKLKSELQMSVHESYFWCDSQLVIQYVQNKKQRFHTFVANRIAIIHQASDPKQWRHIPGKENPADDITRGMSAQNMKNSDWFTRPNFLKRPESEWKTDSVVSELSNDDPEVKRNVICAAERIQTNFMDEIMSKGSSYFYIRRKVAWLLIFKEYITSKARGKKYDRNGLSVLLLKAAEDEIISYVQRTNFPEELEALQSEKSIKKSSVLYKSTPILHRGIICVGGRLRNSIVPYDSKHQIILPKNHVLCKLIIQEAHQKGHTGTEHVLSQIRERFWIIRVRPMIKKCISECFDCRRKLGKPASQFMSDLPADRVKPDDPPFT